MNRDEYAPTLAEDSNRITLLDGQGINKVVNKVAHKVVSSNKQRNKQSCVRMENVQQAANELRGPRDEAGQVTMRAGRAEAEQREMQRPCSG